MFCVVELGVLSYARTMSGLAHVRAVTDMYAATELSAATSAAACTEGMAAIDDFGPALPLLNLGRLMPLATARAWGQVPRLVDAAREACPPLKLYASLAPWPERSIQAGATADLLTDIRNERSRLEAGRAQLADAWSTLGSLDLQALAADPRLARIARAISTAREQQADVADALTLASPAHMETLLGGDGPRSIVLSVISGDAGDAVGQAYAVIQDGRVVRVDIGTPSVSPEAVISLDHAGLASVEGKLSHLQLPDGASASASAAEQARAVLDEVVRVPLSSDEAVLSALRHSADVHQAWLWFEDPALQELASRRGWVRP